MYKRTHKEGVIMRSNAMTSKVRVRDYKLLGNHFKMRPTSLN